MHTRRARQAVTRREFLGRAGVLAGAVALGPSLLAACGGDDDDSQSGSGSSKTGGGGDPKRLVMSNWPLYIDPTTYGTKGSVELVRAATVDNFKDVADFNDNNDFFAKIHPTLQAAKPLALYTLSPSDALPK